MSRPVLSVRADGVVCFGDVQLWGWGFWGALKSTALFWVALMWGHTVLTSSLSSPIAKSHLIGDSHDGKSTFTGESPWRYSCGRPKFVRGRP